MPQLTEWLKLMVAEINRKREDAELATQEEVARKKEEPAPQPTRT
jgi:hypothetical protein